MTGFEVEAEDSAQPTPTRSEDGDDHYSYPHKSTSVVNLVRHPVSAAFHHSAFLCFNDQMLRCYFLWILHLEHSRGS